MFIGEPSGSIRSRVSNRSWGILVEEIRYLCSKPISAKSGKYKIMRPTILRVSVLVILNEHAPE